MQEYTADEYCGFVQTGNRFIQKTEEEKHKAYADIKRLADRHGGKINRPYLCVLYLAKRANHFSGLLGKTIISNIS